MTCDSYRTAWQAQPSTGYPAYPAMCSNTLESQRLPHHDKARYVCTILCDCERSNSTMGMTALHSGCGTSGRLPGVQVSRRGLRAQRAVTRPACKAAAQEDSAMGFKMMRKGIKEASADTVLTPRFYTTDFDEMERLFNLELNPHIDMAEIEACLREFRTDYNQTHFVRNDSFKSAADNVTGETRRIFIEFLERSCTAEFSGFLLYKELGRRLKKTNPAVAEIFSLMVSLVLTVPALHASTYTNANEGCRAETKHVMLASSTKPWETLILPWILVS